MSTNDQDVRALEYLANRIRQDTPGCKPWDAEGCHIVFARELKGMQLAGAAELVIAHAADTDAKTPAAIKRPFTPTVKPTSQGAYPPKRDQECPDHIGELPVPFCRVHATESVRADYDQPDQAPKPGGAAMVRAAMNQNRGAK